MAEDGSPQTPEGGVRASYSLLRRNRDFRKVYVASAISLGGDWFLLVALFGLVFDLTDSPLAIAFLLAAQDLTYFVVSPFTGVLADRLDRKRLMVVADIARAVLCLGFLAVQSEAVVWVVYPLLAAMACFSAAFEPASAAALPNLVEGEDLATANALSGSLWGTMLVVGAAVGGVGHRHPRPRYRHRDRRALVRGVGLVHRAHRSFVPGGTRSPRSRNRSGRPRRRRFATLGGITGSLRCSRSSSAGASPAACSSSSRCSRKDEFHAGETRHRACCWPLGGSAR